MHNIITAFKNLLSVLLVAICLLIPFSSFAQVSILPRNIDKILIKDWQGGLYGKGYINYEVKLENNKWISTQIERYSNTLDLKFDSITNSHQRKFVNNINKADIDRLLFALNHPIKTLQPQTLGITAKFLIDHVDSLYKRPYAFKPGQRALFKKLITQQNINKGILKSGTTGWNDVAAHCTLKIISRTGDTISIASIIHSDFMFPWLINNKESVYNLAISKFCAAAVNDTYSNKYLLSGRSAYRAIYDYIYYTYINKP